MQEQIIPTNPEDAEAMVQVIPEVDVIQGINATIQIGETTTLTPGSDATVENVGTDTHAVLNFGIPEGERGETGPRGPQGETGDSATIQMSATATTLSAGSQATATITNSGDSHNANYTLALGIPQGIQGERGVQGVQGERGPQGVQGIQGVQGVQGVPGKDFSIYKTYASVAEMNADAANVPEGDFVMIASTTQDPDNAKLYVKNGEGSFTYLSDLSGAQGIQGPQGVQGVQGIQGIQGPQGETGPRGSVKSQYVAELPATGDEDTFYLVDRDLESHTESGEYISFETTQTAAAIQSAQIDGNATQNGTPTPDAPVAVNTTTGENMVKITGKNLLSLTPYRTGGDWYNLSVGAQVVPATSTNITLTPIQNGVQATISSGWQGAWYICKVAEGQTYTFKYTQSGTNARTTQYTLDENHTIVRKIAPIASDNYTYQNAITIAEGEKYFALAFGASNRGSVVELTEPQLELGSTATSYEPYHGQSYTINLGSIELAKIGNYQDRIYKNDGKWYIEKQVGKYIFNGTENFGSLQADTSTTRILGVFPSNIESALAGAQLPLSDHFVGKPMWLVDDTGIFVQNRSAVFRAPNTVVGTTIESFKAWFQSNPTTVYYALATPTTTEITDQTLIDQLEALASATLNQGVNNIFTEIVTGNATPTLELNWVEWEKHNRHNVCIWNDDIDDWQIIVGAGA